MNCPFCNEDNFDLPGLKMHLENGWCDRYNEVELPKRWGPREPNLPDSNTATVRAEHG